MNSTLALALLSAAVLGFRHGFDYDHIAAISDITSVELSPRRAMGMGLLYVLGHAATVAALGAAVISYQKSLPASIDHWAERAVGLTLVLLGVYVLGTLSRAKSDFVPRSRAVILIAAFRWITNKVRSIFGATPTVTLLEPSSAYTRKSVFLIGVIHGLGAETPSQLLLFLLAANLGGVARGFLGLGVFLAGLVAMNTLMTASAVGLFGASAARPRLLRVVTACTAAYSLVVGLIFLFGSSSLLPPLGS
jgi:high-affinity nickel-transport protein